MEAGVSLSLARKAGVSLSLARKAGISLSLARKAGVSLLLARKTFFCNEIGVSLSFAKNRLWCTTICKTASNWPSLLRHRLQNKTKGGKYVLWRVKFLLTDLHLRESAMLYDVHCLACYCLKGTDVCTTACRKCEENENIWGQWSYGAEWKCVFMVLCHAFMAILPNRYLHGSFTQ